jgi:nucleoside 2-deoxyribosyltransferase
MAKPKIYLAGPEVFLADSSWIVREKKTVCDSLGLEGADPLDNKIDRDGKSPFEIAIAIAQANEQMMDGCDAIIADMTPFRGPSMDVGTAYEMGFMRGRGKPVFGYSNDPAPYAEKVLEDRGDITVFEQTTPNGVESKVTDADGMTVENFGLVDNLMLEGAVRAIGSEIFLTEIADGNPIAELGAFPDAATAAAEFFAKKTEAAMSDDDRKRLTDEWTSCRNALGDFDKSLLDLRRFGFTLVTILLGADGFLSAKTDITGIGIVGIFAALLILIVGLFQQDRMQEVFIRSTVIRAMELEERLGIGLSFQISYWSERVRTGTWGTLLYHFFCTADLGLAIAALLTPEKLSAGSWSFWGEIVLCVLSLELYIGAIILIRIWNRSSEPLSTAFQDELNKVARQRHLAEVS